MTLEQENEKLKKEIENLLELKEMVDIAIKESKVLYDSDKIKSLKEENKKLKEQVGDLYTKNIGDRFAALEDTEYLKEENKRLKDLEIRAYNLLFEANNHLDADDTKLRLEIEDWIKDSLDNPFSPDAICEDK